MPVKQRLSIGASNKNLSRQETPKSTKHVKSKDCVCHLCTCGRHRCGLRQQTNNAKTTKGEPLEGCSESKEQYRQLELPEHKLFKPKVEFPPQQSLDTSTEHHDQFINRPLPERPPPRENKYNPNPNPLEDLSENHEAYKQWPHQGVPVKFKKAAYQPNENKLEGVSESKTQFIERPLPKKPAPRVNVYVPNPNPMETVSVMHREYKEWPNQGGPRKFKQEYKPSQDLIESMTTMKIDYKPIQDAARTLPLKKASEYVPPNGLMDTSSLYKEEFKQYANVKPPKRHEVPKPQFERDERSFESTTGTSYVPIEQQFIQPPQKRKQPYVPNHHLLEGISVNHTDYLPLDLSANLQNAQKMKEKALKDRQGTFQMHAKEDLFQGKSVSHETYQQKQLGPQNRAMPIRPPASTTIQGVPLEGESVLHRDYQAPAAISKDGLRVYQRPANFKPVEGKRTGDEDRDFVSISKTSFTDRIWNEKCPVVKYEHREKVKGEDGHLYIMASTNNLSLIA